MVPLRHFGTRLIFISLACLSLMHMAHAQGEFPGRAVFKNVPVVSTEELAAKFEDYVKIDVRSEFEYKTLHMKSAANVPLADAKFADHIASIREAVGKDKPIVFYCNGKTCYKSYKACQRVMESGIKKVFAYDAGIFDWARANPSQASLLGRSPVDPNKLIPKSRLKERMLSPGDFAKKVSRKVAVLDIRDPNQSMGVSLFPGYQRTIPLDKSDSLNRFLARALDKGKPILVYDNVGKQVRWMQYYLEDLGVEEYWFMEGGARAFYKYLGK